jgi:hypothetical protein
VLDGPRQSADHVRLLENSDLPTCMRQREASRKSGWARTKDNCRRH